ncbi:integrase catalytic domain-containing protein [Trichonephila clavipes]|uniref:Integrase catalytic domain-containing protein n=1 Tax=Trichonephila clavipes TaxID=2585209 RepID=A0A8X6WDH9_TRICX|nr:integrase catalytic domain-containing protein [Trichonephila clavipes]
MANIESLKKSRINERASFTKAYNRVEELIALEDVDICKLEAELNVFKWKVGRLENTHSIILEFLPEKDYDAEFGVVENRCFSPVKSGLHNQSIHTFCDASQYAYAAAVFVRIEYSGVAHANLLAVKLRIYPVKTITIPHLELLAATVGTRLCRSVLKALEWDNVKQYYWTDCTTIEKRKTNPSPKSLPVVCSLNQCENSGKNNIEDSERRAYLGCCGNGGLEIPRKAKVIDLKKLIESSAVYKNDIEFVRSLVENALEKNEREAEKNKREAEKNKREAEKYKREAEIQLEKIKLSQIEKQLELEKAFQIKSVPDELKAEILLNILGERVNNLLTYVSQENLSNYVKIKELILREFEPTPQECLSNFKKARKLPSENYVQFASRLNATFDYYCQLRKVNEFRSLCDLIISDKIFETLDRDTMTHIATKQGETYFKPQQLGRECDVYLSARGKVSNDLMSRNPGSGVKTDGRNRLQMVGTLRERETRRMFS